jgi:beta-phosphoglucomutase-like phosphatase (HAD superfamily)
VQLDPLVASVGGTLVLGLIGLVTWFARRQVERLEADLVEEKRQRVLEVSGLRKEFDATLERERETNKRDRHDLRDALNGVGGRVAELREKVIGECINHEHLAAAMKPVMDRLGELRGDIKEIFVRLERKQDKPMGAD